MRSRPAASLRRSVTRFRNSLVEIQNPKSKDFGFFLCPIAPPETAGQAPPVSNFSSSGDSMRELSGLLSSIHRRLKPASDLKRAPPGTTPLRPHASPCAFVTQSRHHAPLRNFFNFIRRKWAFKSEACLSQKPVRKHSESSCRRESSEETHQKLSWPNACLSSAAVASGNS